MIVVLSIAAAGGGRAHAHAPPPPAWEFYVTPYAWFAGLNGSLRTPLDRFPGRDFSADFDTLLADISGVPIMGMAEVRYGRFGVVGDLLYLSLDQNLDTRDVAFRGGHSLVNTAIGNVLGLYRALDLPNQSLDIGAGVRIWSTTAKVSLNPGLLPGAIQKSTTTWADPLIAARYHLALSDRFGLTAYGDVGGFSAGSVLTWQAIGAIDYRASEAIVLSLGWRYLSFDRKRGDFHLDLGFTGPFIAATFRF